jgi:hypothetical protein
MSASLRRKAVTLEKAAAAGLAASFLAAGAALAQGSGAIPNFAPDNSTSWYPDRPTGDDFLPPESGPGPVISDPVHPYVPNGGGRQPTYRIADLSNPNLLPWVVEALKKANDNVLTGGIPFSARERCWPGGVPEFDVFRRVAPFFIVQTPKEVVMVQRGDMQTRHIYLDVPHASNPKPSWYGDSVGHYEGDTLAVDTVGQNDKTYVDNYMTPHTAQIHVVERFRLIEGGSTLEIRVEVDDPGAFKQPWRAINRFKRYDEGPMRENVCAENNFDFLGYKVAPIPRATRPDF